MREGCANDSWGVAEAAAQRRLRAHLGCRLRTQSCERRFGRQKAWSGWRTAGQWGLIDNDVYRSEPGESASTWRQTCAHLRRPPEVCCGALTLPVELRPKPGLQRKHCAPLQRVQ